MRPIIREASLCLGIPEKEIEKYFRWLSRIRLCSPESRFTRSRLARIHTGLSERKIGAVDVWFIWRPYVERAICSFEALERLLLQTSRKMAAPYPQISAYAWTILLAKDSARSIREIARIKNMPPPWTRLLNYLLKETYEYQLQHLE